MSNAAPPAPHTAFDRLATLLATGFGAGYSPVAPGTAGSLVGLLLFWPLARTLFIADVHLGKAASFRAAGVPLPSGHSSRDIGSQLGVSTKTVEAHRARINDKMRADDLPHLIRMIMAYNEEHGQ